MIKHHTVLWACDAYVMAGMHFISGIEPATPTLDKSLSSFITSPGLYTLFHRAEQERLEVYPCANTISRAL